MPPASRIGDQATGHDCYSPSNAIKGSPDVITCSSPQHRITDDIAAHSGCPSSHGRKAAKGSATVFVNSLNLVRIGDAVDCGGVLAQGCPTVIVGG